ncbi:HlyD family secretion protein [Acidocella sp.]|uniref:HlyD family secretion protein n=1 Tax=Acidocella sp. TaxID=50710 RepID=UPI002614AB7F|nr:HlyD family secretion protein [Acidocella sp.]
MSISLFSKRALGVVAALLVVAALIIWLVQYLLTGQYFIGTDDAYIAADSSLIAAKISGYVSTVDVLQDQKVKQGQLLVTIDARDYTNAAQVADAAVANARAGLALQQYKIQSAAATLQADKARAAFAARNEQRYASLTKTGASTRQQAEQANTDLAAVDAQMAADNANEQAAQAEVDVLQAALDKALAQAAQAHLNLSHTQIRAPFDGVVGNKTVAVGDYLQPGAQIMAVVPLGQVYVVANYKETQITRIRPGQHVSLVVDAYPGLKVTGHVDSIFPASGQEFALLPPDNATGNFTKIVQRVPVKILLDLTPALIGKLRPGMSVEPEIDTRP